MRTLYVDSVGGLAGDMFLGAALDAGFASLDELQTIVARWLPEPVRLVSQEVSRNAMRARTFRVEVDAPASGGHAHAETHTHGHALAHAHRHLGDVERLLDACPIPPGAVGRAKAMFRALAEAEAKAHGAPVEKVHFHEVGAVDSLVDFALSAFVLDRLGARVEASPALLGRGRTRMEHGDWPVPPPGTAEILRRGRVPARALPPSFPWENAELTTPTGACLLLFSESFGDLPAGRIEAVGTGAGTLDPPGFPNVTRLFLVETSEAAAVSGRYERDTVGVLETWLDDFPGNLLSTAVEELLGAGAHDVAISPATFKKGRTGFRIEVLAPEERVERLAEILLGRTTAIGLRVGKADRWKLQRRAAEADGGVAGKAVRDAAGAIARTAPETEALAARAREGGPAPMFGWRIRDDRPRSG